MEACEECVEFNEREREKTKECLLKEYKSGLK